MESKHLQAANPTHLELTIRIDQQISRLQVTVENVGGVNVLETTQNLVEKVLKVSIRQGLLGPNDLMHISLHQLLNDITTAGNMSIMTMVKIPPPTSPQNCHRAA
jgi:hypothetical protein